MLPVLLDLKFVKIYTYGVFLVLAFFWASFLLWKNIRLTSHKEEEMFDVLFLSLVGALVGGRIMYVVTHFDKFGFDIIRIILINGYPGLSLIGALLGGFATVAVFLMVNKIKFRETVDYFISPLFLAIAIGKLGAFFSGVEVGVKTKFPIALKYANFDGFRHVTPLYESVLFFLGAFLSYRLLFEIRRGKHPKGIVFYYFLWYFSLVYFVLDPIKSSHVMIFNFSLNQIISGALLLTFSLYFLYYIKGGIFGKIIDVKNYLIEHGQKNNKTIHHTAGNKVERGEEEDSSTG